MTFQQKAVLAGLAIALVFLPACRQAKGPPPPTTPGSGPGPGHHYGQQKARAFAVYIYTDPANPQQCYVDSNVVTIWKSDNQIMQWISDDGKPYLVDFTLGKQHTSPFSQPTFQVHENGLTPSGAATQETGYYEYGIRAGTAPDSPICKQAADPGVYVK